MPEAIVVAVAWAIVIGAGGVVATALTFARARYRKAAQPAATDQAELSELREAVHRLTGDVAELQERVDFAERLLAQQRQPPALDPGK